MFLTLFLRHYLDSFPRLRLARISQRDICSARMFLASVFANAPEQSDAHPCAASLQKHARDISARETSCRSSCDLSDAFVESFLDAINFVPRKFAAACFIVG